ncbi:MAG: glycosyl transferase family 1 [Planctomycetaceae bacterium]|nr:glycosyl transferase family 1 [Planctomycetaceae bacterium]
MEARTFAGERRPRAWIIGGGGLQLRIPLMRLLEQRGFEMAAVGPGATDAFAAAGFCYHRFPLRRALNPLADFRASQALQRLFLQHRPDLVHCVNTKPTLLVPPAARRTGVAGCIRTITGLGALFSSSSPLALSLRLVYRQLQRKSERHCDFTVFQNPNDREYFRHHRMSFPGRDTVVLGSGIDVEAVRARQGSSTVLSGLRRELQLDGQAPVVMMAARLIRPKGVGEFLEAATAVRRVRPEVTFLLVGPEVREGPAIFPIERVRDCPDVRFLGWRDDVADLMAISDLLVLPSYFREGIPRVLLEGAALGLPLITTDMPGCREVVTDGVNGLLVPARNGPQLATAVLELLDDPTRCRDMGRASRILVEKTFHLETVAAAYADIYHRVLGTAEPVGFERRRAA